MNLQDLSLGTFYEFPLETGNVQYLLDQVRRNPRRRRYERDITGLEVVLRYDFEGQNFENRLVGLSFFLSNAIPVTGVQNNIIGRLLDLPHYIVFEEVEFNLELFPNHSELRLCYSISSVEKFSKHYLTITEAGYWDNPLLKQLNQEPPEDPATIIKGDGYPDFSKSVSPVYPCSFLYLWEGIENLQDLEQAVKDTKDFLTKHNLLQ
jgi:hypothetical protein